MFAEAFGFLEQELSKIHDKRRQKSIKHTLVSLVFYAILMFLFRFCSRKEIQTELAKPTFNKYLKVIFPGLGDAPHSSTVNRIMSSINPLDIEKRHVKLIKKLIKKKKFRDFLILGHLPISIDGVQKLVRNTVQTEHWLKRSIKTKDGKIFQQYVAILECNITLKNGITIPLLSEFLASDTNDESTKQDCELKGFIRICEKLKKYFPRQQILIMLDKLYATSNVIQLIDDNKWKYGIVLPSKKCSVLNAALSSEKDNKIQIPNQKHYSKREQSWYFKNNISWKGNTVNAVACFEKYYKTSSSTGEIETQYSEHKWITNFKVSIDNVHELCNLGFRKRWGIEDSNNTEKNRGYQYKHLFSSNWNAMQCFHFVIRIAHAINALSEFKKKFKKYMKEYGIDRILRLVRETLMAPFIEISWFEKKMQEISLS